MSARQPKSVHLALSGALLITPLAASLATLPAWAQSTEAEYVFAIAAGSLETAVVEFSSVAGVTVSFAPDVARGRQSPGVQGRFTASQALQRLLEGSGVQAVQQGNGSYSLLPPSGQADALQLGATSITGTGLGSTTEGSGSYSSSGPSRSATKLDLSVRETPQSISVITRQRLDNQKLDSVSEVLDATVGITTFNQGIGTDLDQPYSRGFIISNYLVDGLPRSSSRTFNLRAGTAMFDRVEVVRGATGLMSGMGSPGAAINLIRKRPTTVPLMSISAEAGSWDHYGLGSDVSGAFNESGSIRGRLVLDQQDQNSWLDRYQSRSSLAYGISEFDLAEATLLTLGFSHQTNDHEAPMRSGVPLFYNDDYRNGIRIDLPRSYNNAPAWSYYDTEQSNLFLSLDHGFGNGWNGKLELSHARYAQDAVSYYQYGAIDPASGLGSSIAPVKWNQADKQNSLDAYLSGPFPLFGREHELVAGVALSRIDGETDDYGWLYGWNSDYDGTLGDIWEWDGHGAERPQFTRHGKTDNEETQRSAYLTARFSLSQATSLIVGSRVIDWQRRADTLASSGARSKTERKENGVLVPFAGVIHALDDTWSLYGSYTQIFNPQSASVRDINNSPLDPEAGSAYEVGVKAGLQDGRLNANLALFRVEQDNIAEYDGTISAYRALQGITTEGVELELDGELAEGWNIAGGYAYSLSEDAEGQRAMSRIPRHSVKAFSTYRLSGELDRLTVGGGLNWKSRYGYEGQGYPQQSSYMLVELMARYDISEQLTAALNLNNVLDKKYYASLTENGVYGAPRSALLGVKYSF
ncbi:TonB-dependent siderophore receptor [Phytopseudomonas dryadis]|uniref:TonB-dependent siderophore receptor n=1 Tax=Phytopseudomonas dryadis TaxID=2487520 RepID=A0A4Q9QT60_9GAMM|nr:TonB-dependent receptor [Pseudomonas dryadis]TBU85615.1 TonB-dependent siderophore receptor [Pseudomonas dryadis]